MQSTYKRNREFNELREVQIDSLAIMKIFEHCKDYYPDSVTGQLLGIDVDGVLKITNCFPFIKQQEPRDEMQDQEDGASYQYEVIKCYETLGYDSNAVGWYQSTNLGIYWSQSLVETQFNYQTTIPGGILLLCDPYRGVEGDQCIKAMRLKTEFVKLFSEGRISSKTFNKGFDKDSIFENLPVKVSNTHLYRTFIRGLNTPKVGSIPIGLPIGSMFNKAPSLINSYITSQAATNSQKLDHNTSCMRSESEEILEKHLEYLSEIVEEHSNELWRWNCWIKTLIKEKQLISASSTTKQHHGYNLLSNIIDKMSDEQIQEQYPTIAKLLASEPPRVECLVMSNQANTCCKQITKLSGASITDLYLSHNLMSHPPSSSNS